MGLAASIEGKPCLCLGRAWDLVNKGVTLLKMIQGRREEKCCLQANPIMPRGGEPFDEACTHWEKGKIDLAGVSR